MDPFKRTLAGSMAGAVLEWYEFAIYGTLAATVFAEQFFPATAPHAGMLMAFGTQAVGFVARPLGGIDALRHPIPLLQGLGVRIGENVAFYIYTVFVIAYATHTLLFALPDVVRAVLVASVCQFAAMLIGGWLSDVLGRKPVMIAAALGLAAWAPIFFFLAQQESLALLFIGICVAATLHGLLGGPEAAWITELFPTRHRYAGSSLAFQGSSIVAGGPAPLIATALMGANGNTTPVAIYLIVCALISAVAVASGPETRGQPLDNVR